MSLPAHVLLVDDDPQVREVVTKLLLRIVDEVTVVENGRKAVHSFSDRLPDLVLADVIMPGMSGCNLTQRIVDVDPEARVVLMSGDERALKEIEDLARGVGAIGYLPKPFSSEALKQTLENAMEGGARESEVPIPGGQGWKVRNSWRSRIPKVIERVPKVLIIDDDPVARMILKQLLSRIATVEIVEAVDGLDGLTKAREQGPDLVFLEMNMPVKDGLETLRELREDPELGDFSVIIVSSIVDFVKMRKAMKLGVLEYLAKPIRYDMVTGLGKLLESLGSPMTGLTNQ